MRNSKANSRLSAMVVAAIITTVGVLIAAVISNWGQLWRDKTGDSALDEATALKVISEVLRENQVVNSYYADFQKRADMKTPFREYLLIYKYAVDTKTALLGRLKKVRPPERLARLHRILMGSLESDIEIVKAEDEGMRDMLGHMGMMESMLKNQPPDDPKATEDEKRETALKVLGEFFVRNREYLERARKREAREKSARLATGTALDLLNEELNALGLPYRHENPFNMKKPAEGPESPPSGGPAMQQQKAGPNGDGKASPDQAAQATEKRSSP